MNLICKIFGHKNFIRKDLGVKSGRHYYYGKSSPWNCLRCGEYTQKLFFTNPKSKL